LEGWVGRGDVEGFFWVALLFFGGRYVLVVGLWGEGREGFVEPFGQRGRGIRLAWIPSPGLCLQLLGSELHRRTFGLGGWRRRLWTKEGVLDLCSEEVILVVEGQTWR